MKKRIDFCFDFLLNHPILTSNFSFRNKQLQKSRYPKSSIYCFRFFRWFWYTVFSSKPTIFCVVPFWTFFQVSLMIRWYCKLSLYMIDLSLYCRNISFFSSGWYTFRASSRHLISPPLSSQNYWIHSRGANKQKKETMSYPRCGFGACLRCGWAS